ncbi:hypothetical protein WH47_09656, partial [Habropoda laboriosa]
GMEYTKFMYIVLAEAIMRKVQIRTGQRTIRYEKGLRKGRGRDLLKQYLLEKKKGVVKPWTWKGRDDYSKRNGLSQEGLEWHRRQNNDTEKMLGVRNWEVQLQVQYQKIQQPKYNWRFKYYRPVRLPQYLEKDEKQGSQELIARTRCGNTEEANRYWMKEEQRKRILCEEGLESLKHRLEECRGIENKDITLEEL